MDYVKIDKKPISNWTALDFLRYFKRVYEMTYVGQTYDIVFESPGYLKDCAIFKRIIGIFKKYDKPKTTVIKFIDWVFAEYIKRPDFTIPLTPGFLPYWIDEFLQLRTKELKKQKVKTIELSDDTKRWLEKQKQMYEELKNVE